MTPVLADITEPIPLVESDSGYPTGVLLSPVFVAGGARRRRLLARWGYLAAAACLAYVVMLGVSLTATPASKPGSAAKPAPSVTGVGAATTAASRPARPVSALQAPVDSDAAQDGSLGLRLALPVTRRAAPSSPTATTGPGATASARASRPHRHNDDPDTTHPPTIGRTPAASSVPVAPTSTRKPVTP